ALLRGRPALQRCVSETLPRSAGASRLNGYGLLGHSQPSSQFLQQSHSQLQSGQSLQQSSEQQADALVPQVGSLLASDVP
ncbi:MAG: hypothetical protein WD738_06390, partial [Pirellulales bacterium]